MRWTTCGAWTPLWGQPLSRRATTSSVATTVSRSAPGKLAAAATRWAAGPLIREGSKVRTRVGTDAGPTAQRLIGQATPAVLDMVSLDRILAAIDLDALLDRIDIDGIINQIDLNAVLAKIDMDALLAQVDIDELIGNMDIDALVANTEIGSLVARSTSGVASEALDAVRSQGVGLDNFVARIVTRIIRREAAAAPDGPPLLLIEDPAPHPNGNHP